MTLLTCSHCDGAIKPRREAKDRHGRRRYCSRTCSAAGARASAKAARALLLRLNDEQTSRLRRMLGGAA